MRIVTKVLSIVVLGVIIGGSSMESFDFKQSLFLRKMVISLYLGENGALFPLIETFPNS